MAIMFRITPVRRKKLWIKSEGAIYKTAMVFINNKLIITCAV